MLLRASESTRPNFRWLSDLPLRLFSILLMSPTLEIAHHHYHDGSRCPDCRNKASRAIAAKAAVERSHQSPRTHAGRSAPPAQSQHDLANRALQVKRAQDQLEKDIGSRHGGKCPQPVSFASPGYKTRKSPAKSWRSSGQCCRKCTTTDACPRHRHHSSRSSSLHYAKQVW